MPLSNPQIENANATKYLNQIKQQVLEQLRCLEHAPSVQMHEVEFSNNIYDYIKSSFISRYWLCSISLQVPPDHLIPELDDELANPDERISQMDLDKYIQPDVRETANLHQFIYAVG